MKQILIALLIFLIASPFLTQAQRWKKTRYEFTFGMGPTEFMGDLGGGTQNAAHFFGIRDMDITSTRFVAQAGFRYKIFEPLAIHANLSWAQVSGNDAYSGDVGRKSRNLSFKSPIFETSFQFEYSLIGEPTGTTYARQRFKGLRRYGVNVYLFAGIGGFYYNPKGLGPDGQWHELRPLRTEGEGIPDTTGRYHTAPVYSSWAFCIPIGIGFKYFINKQWGIQMEIGNRYTSTDYIDDTSGNYVDPKFLRDYFNKYGTSQQAELAVYFSDRHLVEDPVGSGNWRMHNSTETYPQGPNHDMPPRGSPNYKDSYIFMIFSAVYRLKTTRTGLPKF